MQWVPAKLCQYMDCHCVDLDTKQYLKKLLIRSRSSSAALPPRAYQISQQYQRMSLFSESNSLHFKIRSFMLSCLHLRCSPNIVFSQISWLPCTASQWQGSRVITPLVPGMGMPKYWDLPSCNVITLMKKHRFGAPAMLKDQVLGFLHTDSHSSCNTELCNHTELPLKTSLRGSIDSHSSRNTELCNNTELPLKTSLRGSIEKERNNVTGQLQKVCISGHGKCDRRAIIPLHHGRDWPVHCLQVTCAKLFS